MTLDPSTPVLIGVGQAVDHWDGSDAAAAPSPQSLMQRAAEAALADTGAAEAVRAALVSRGIDGTASPRKAWAKRCRWPTTAPAKAASATAGWK